MRKAGGDRRRRGPPAARALRLGHPRPDPGKRFKESMVPGLAPDGRRRPEHGRPGSGRVLGGPVLWLSGHWRPDGRPALHQSCYDGPHGPGYGHAGHDCSGHRSGPRGPGQSCGTAGFHHHGGLLPFNSGRGSALHRLSPGGHGSQPGGHRYSQPVHAHTVHRIRCPGLPHDGW